MEGLSNNKEGKVFHSIRVLLIGIAVITNVYKLAAMVRVCNTGWACNILQNIDPNFIVHYFVHGSKSSNFASQF